LTDNKDKNTGNIKKGYHTEGNVEGFSEDNIFFLPMTNNAHSKVPTC